MARKPKPWPRCVAPLCESNADERIHMEGENCYFHGHLCHAHAEALASALPATCISRALLHIITQEALHAALLEGKL